MSAEDKLTILKLARVIEEMDCHLPRGEELADDADKPAWCRVFCDGLDTPAGECCGICGILSETTRNALDRAFA